MNTAVIAAGLAESGTTWKKGKGAACPVCKQRMRVGTKQGDVRYCYCKTPGCIMAVMRAGVKVLEERVR